MRSTRLIKSILPISLVISPIASLMTSCGSEQWTHYDLTAPTYTGPSIEPYIDNEGIYDIHNASVLYFDKVQENKDIFIADIVRGYHTKLHKFLESQSTGNLKINELSLYLTTPKFGTTTIYQPMGNDIEYPIVSFDMQIHFDVTDDIEYGNVKDSKRYVGDVSVSYTDVVFFAYIGQSSLLGWDSDVDSNIIVGMFEPRMNMYEYRNNNKPWRIRLSCDFEIENKTTNNVTHESNTTFDSYNYLNSINNSTDLYIAYAGKPGQTAFEQNLISMALMFDAKSTYLSKVKNVPKVTMDNLYCVYDYETNTTTGKVINSWIDTHINVECFDTRLTNPTIEFVNNSYIDFGTGPHWSHDYPMPYQYYPLNGEASRDPISGEWTFRSFIDQDKSFDKDHNKSAGIEIDTTEGSQYSTLIDNYIYDNITSYEKTLNQTLLFINFTCDELDQPIKLECPILFKDYALFDVANLVAI